jgi:ABC-type xylose transport system substrate-binding protein
VARQGVHVSSLFNHLSAHFRLDFVTFVIANPDATAGTATSGTATQCLTDMFTVSGQSNNVPGICGTNTNQHSKLISPLRHFISF